MWHGQLACHTLVGCFMFCECLWFWKQVLYVYHFGERAGEWDRKKGIVLRKRKTGDWNGKLPFALISVLGHRRNSERGVRWKQAVLYISRRVFYVRDLMFCPWHPALYIYIYIYTHTHTHSHTHTHTHIHFSFVMRIFHKNTYRWTERAVTLSRVDWDHPPFSFVVQLLAGKVMEVIQLQASAFRLCPSCNG